MRISEHEYTFETFIKELMEVGIEPGERLRVVSYMANEREWKTESPMVPSLNDLMVANGVNVLELGDAKKLVAHYRDRETNQLVSVTYFAFLHHDTRLLFCFTTASKFEVEQTLDRIVERNPGLYYGWISSLTFGRLDEMLLESHPGTLITYFSARRNRQSALRSEIRPDYERSFEYYGNDGRNVLEELKHAYGITPRSIHFEIPDFAEFQVHNSGQFTLSKGESDARRFLLKIVDFAMRDSLLMRKTVESGDFRLIPLETERKTLLFPKLKPWLIKFSLPLDFREGENLVDILQDSDFDVFNHVLAPGSLRLNGMVADRVKNAIFTIDVNPERMVVAPLQDVPFDSFLRFYQAIIEKFDPNAVCEVSE
jgi:hypothetical protein